MVYDFELLVSPKFDKHIRKSSKQFIIRILDMAKLQLWKVWLFMIVKSTLQADYRQSAADVME